MPAPMLFSPYEIRDVRLKNRIVIAPMHQYAAVDGFAQDWHLVNAGRFATGGAGLVMVESTKVDRRGCGTVGDLGLWHDDFVPGLAKIAKFIRNNGSLPAIQLGHSGRKARRARPWEGGAALADPSMVKDWAAWDLVAPSALAAAAGDPEPRALANQEVKDLVAAWGLAARRADAAGFDILEIHAAHGYLIHQFLSPKANIRNDEYGGSAHNRMRFACEVVESVRTNWPAHKPLFMRFSVEDDAGWGPDESVELARRVKPLGVDVIDCSSGGMTGSPTNRTAVGYGYQVPYAQRLREDADIQTMAVGLIVHADQAEQILRDGRADLIALAREALFNPNWPLDAARKLGVGDDYAAAPPNAAFWLAKREGVAGLRPSTYSDGLGDLP